MYRSYSVCRMHRSYSMYSLYSMYSYSTEYTKYIKNLVKYYHALMKTVTFGRRDVGLQNKRACGKLVQP